MITFSKEGKSFSITGSPEHWATDKIDTGTWAISSIHHYGSECNDVPKKVSDILKSNKLFRVF